VTWYDNIDKIPMKYFKFDFTQEKLDRLLDKSRSKTWYPAFQNLLNWDIDTLERVSGFIAQCGHESAGFTRLEENLNYSWQGLMATFGSRYFPSESIAMQYHRQPEKIANYVYMDENRSRRGALGNVEPGDGWRFRGRGLIQLTGRANFQLFGESVNMTPEEAVEYASTPSGAVESACWYWTNRNINRYADARDIEGMTRAINGGLNGLVDRRERWNDALRILGD